MIVRGTAASLCCRFPSEDSKQDQGQYLEEGNWSSSLKAAFIGNMPRESMDLIPALLRLCAGPFISGA
jgi:hypothetical protein